jgi:ParB family transcriptional regulator, chromosome partitioning protein
VIDAEAVGALRSSLEAFGPIKPLVVLESGRLIAGHQRTAQMRAAGRQTAPAWVLAEIAEADEVRFNQLHNGADVEVSDIRAQVANRNPYLLERSGELMAGRWHMIAPDDLDCELCPPHAPAKSEILRLLARYGPWGSCIATDSGRILVSGLYAACCQILRLPCLTYVVPEHRAGEIRRIFGREYGRFSYTRLDRTTWGQSMCQLYRLRGDHQNRSTAYELGLIPRLEPGMRVLDLGAGQFDYIHQLRDGGIDIIGWEPYRRVPGTNVIDVEQVHRDTDELCRALRTRGRFDAVVLDSVLNSTDTPEAEEDVLLTAAALCRPGGLIIVTGRSREYIEARSRGTRDTALDQRNLQFLDDTGRSALYNRGLWQYQAFHTRDHVREIGIILGETLQLDHIKSGRLAKPEHAATWLLVARNAADQWPHALCDAVCREFDLPLPDGARYGRGDDVLRALNLPDTRLLTAVG